VLTDILMPGGMSGIDLARALRTRRPDLPVLLTTGYAEGASGEGVDILRKPYRIETLVDAVAAHLRPAR
jgi:CheY-like chemotaxis protein